MNSRPSCGRLRSAIALKPSRNARTRPSCRRAVAIRRATCHLRLGAGHLHGLQRRSHALPELNANVENILRQPAGEIGDQSRRSCRRAAASCRRRKTAPAAAGRSRRGPPGTPARGAPRPRGPANRPAPRRTAASIALSMSDVNRAQTFTPSRPRSCCLRRCARPSANCSRAASTLGRNRGAPTGIEFKSKEYIGQRLEPSRDGGLYSRGILPRKKMHDPRRSIVSAKRGSS